MSSRYAGGWAISAMLSASTTAWSPPNARRRRSRTLLVEQATWPEAGVSGAGTGALTPVYSDAARRPSPPWRDDAGRAARLRHRPPQPGHGLDRGRDRLRRAQAADRPAPRVPPGAPGRPQRPDALGPRAERRGRARVPAPHPAARLRRDAPSLPGRQPPGAGARGGPADDQRGPGARADRRRRGRARGGDHRARAGP